MRCTIKQEVIEAALLLLHPCVTSSSFFRLKALALQSFQLNCAGPCPKSILTPRCDKCNVILLPGPLTAPLFQICEPPPHPGLATWRCLPRTLCFAFQVQTWVNHLVKIYGSDLMCSILRHLPSSSWCVRQLGRACPRHDQLGGARPGRLPRIVRELHHLEPSWRMREALEGGR